MASKIAGLGRIGPRGRAGGMAALALGLLGSAAGAHSTRMVSVDVHGNPGNGDSEQPRVWDDGRDVAFESYASDLVPGDTNGMSDVFVRDLATGAIERVDTSAAGL